MPSPRLSKFERQIMEILWKSSPLTIRQIQEGFDKRKQS